MTFAWTKADPHSDDDQMPKTVREFEPSRGLVLRERDVQDSLALHAALCQGVWQIQARDEQNGHRT